MKAISLWQPWASAMALGLKHYETRHWTTNYRGWLAIHAAKRWTRDEREFAKTMGLADLPLGALVAIGHLSGTLRTDAWAPPSEEEREWGNYGPGRYAWLFTDIRPLPSAVPFRGAQGFFEVPDELLTGHAGHPSPQGVLL